MSERIYLVQDDGDLVTMNSESYATESLLQELLAKYPSLLAGEQIDSRAPRRWLLVAREVPLASEEGGPGRWSVDHLFLDQDGIPTIVEVKRSTDTRMRREVVGQMLDYAANAVVYWPIESIRASFDANSADSEQELSSLLEPGGDSDAFWEQVRTNLKAGKIRMVFVADQIPPELRRIVEFLNGQLSLAEVLAVEVKQYVGAGVRTLVPRVVGQTAEAERKRSTRIRRSEDETSFLQALAESKAVDVADARTILTIYEWCKVNMPLFRWGWHNRSEQVFLYAGIKHNGKADYVFSMWSRGGLNLEMSYLMRNPPFSAESKRAEVLRRLNQIPGFQLPDRAMRHYAPLPLFALRGQAELRQFIEVLDWVTQEIRSY